MKATDPEELVMLLTWAVLQVNSGVEVAHWKPMCKNYIAAINRCSYVVHYKTYEYRGAKITNTAPVAQ